MGDVPDASSWQGVACWSPLHQEEGLLRCPAELHVVASSIARQVAIQCAHQERGMVTEKPPRERCRQVQYKYDRFRQGGVESLPWTASTVTERQRWAALRSHERPGHRAYKGARRHADSTADVVETLS